MFFYIVKHVLEKKGEKGIRKKGTYMNWLIKVKWSLLKVDTMKHVIFYLQHYIIWNDP
jgi:hypothetical protein